MENEVKRWRRLAGLGLVTCLVLAAALAARIL
jgi:hypothetical protein